MIECLTAIAIAAVLIGILLPALRAGKDKGQSVVCQANLKQHAASTFVFVQDEEHFPYGFCSIGGFSSVPPGGFVGDGSDDWRGWWWFHQISENARPQDSAALRCPLQPQTDNPLCGNYGANYAVYKIGDVSQETEFYGTGLKAAHLKRPHRTLLLTDSGYALIGWKATLPYDQVSFENPKRLSSFYLPGLASNAHRSIATSQQTDAVKGRHGGRSVNAAYADGCVQSHKASHLEVNAPDGGSPAFHLWRP